MFSSDKVQYRPIGSAQEEGDEVDGSNGSRGVRVPFYRQLTKSTAMLSGFCVILLVLLSIQSWFILRLERRLTEPHTKLALGYTVQVVANEHSDFDSEDDDVADAAWASIEAGHGDVALDPAEAAALGVPPSFEHPIHGGKSVYVVDAYHAIHCIKVLRDHYMRMYHAHKFVGEWPQITDWPVEHDKHCFDSLRQHVMCHADGTLLYSKGHHDAGVGQVKMCRNWDALRDWASERSAGWKDHINPRPEGEIWWDFDDGGDDGLPKGGLS